MKITLHNVLLLALISFALPASAQDSKGNTDAKPSENKAVETKAAADNKASDAKTASDSKSSPKDFTVITVDGDDVKNSDVQEVWKSLFQGGAVPDFSTFDENIKQNVIRGLVSERLIYKEALKNDYDKNEDIKKRLENLKKQLIIQSYIETKAKALVTDEQIKTLYDEKVAASKGQEELKARHILVANEDEAKKLSESLKKGGDFEKIAKEKSTDKGSGVNGGDLGWFTKDKMVPEFFDAANKLKKGEVSAPVKSSFGWHVIKLEDRRPVKMPSLAESKESLKSELTNKAIQSYVETLLKNANIKYYDENGKEKDFARTLTATKIESKPADEAKPADSKPADAPAKSEEKPAKSEEKPAKIEEKM